MDETLLFPSPNWFQVSILKISSDGFVIYGGPNKSLCVLEPIPANKTQILEGDQSYKAHVINKSHAEKIVSVDISPDWHNKRNFLTGSADGVVRRWTLDGAGNNFKLKCTQTNEYLLREKEEVVGVGYNPTGNYAIVVGCFGNVVKWDLQSNVCNGNSNYLRNFKPSCMACSPHMSIFVAIGTKQGVIFVLDLAGKGKIMYKVRGQDEEIVNISWCPTHIVTVKKALRGAEAKSSKTTSNAEDEIENEEVTNVEEASTATVGDAEASGTGNNLQNDSDDNNSLVAEDDMFDIYKDHAADEFGHKKYEPEMIVVKTVEKPPELDYLAECAKLRNDILQYKKEDEESIESLVEAFDKTHVGSSSNSASISKKGNCKNVREYSMPLNEHIHKHLLASISKFGVVRVWSKTGKLVGSSVVPCNSNKNVKNKGPTWPTLLWYKTDMLLIGDGKCQLLECNPLRLDYKNKIEWRLVHSLHQRSLYCIATQAPRAFKTETDEHWPIWTVSQDRAMIKYCMKERKPIATYPTSGGWVYMIQSCPYDADKIAMCVGDGAVRVWVTSASAHDEARLARGRVQFHWQNVQGKVLKLAWHPTRENCLAFSTAEARVGVIDASGRGDRMARTLVPAHKGGVYALAWAEAGLLYACGAGDLVLYNTDRKHEVPEVIKLEVEGQNWEITEVKWYPHGMVVGSTNGGVAVLTTKRPHTLITASFVFSKMIYTIDWHPQKTSSSNEESAYKNIMAVCSLDRQNAIAIVEFAERGDTKQLTVLKMLSGHKASVFDVEWSPHKDMQLVSASGDGTIRVWDACAGACSHVVAAQAQVMCAAWSARPQLPHALLAGGGDFAVSLVHIQAHPAHLFTESQYPSIPKKMKKKVKEKKDVKKIVENEIAEIDESIECEAIVTTFEAMAKPSRTFLLPIISKQINSNSINAARKMFMNHMSKHTGLEQPSGANDKPKYDCDYLKMFGTINEVNEILDKEMARHLAASNMEQWILLSIFRGHIDTMIQFASQHDILDPFLVSIAPSVSFKYWKEVTQMYTAQIDRLHAKGEEHKLCENKHYGGAVYRRVVSLLSLHDVKAAVTTLKQVNFFKEAYILCRIRHMDSIAEETLKDWAIKITASGNLLQGAICYLALGNVVEATKVLSKSNMPNCLNLALEMAKMTDQPLFAEHIEKKIRNNDSLDSQDAEEPQLKELPMRAELLINHSSNDEDSQSESVTNGDSGLDE